MRSLFLSQIASLSLLHAAAAFSPIELGSHPGEAHKSIYQVQYNDAGERTCEAPSFKKCLRTKCDKASLESYSVDGTITDQMVKSCHYGCFASHCNPYSDETQYLKHKDDGKHPNQFVSTFLYDQCNKICASGQGGELGACYRDCDARRSNYRATGNFFSPGRFGMQAPRPMAAVRKAVRTKIVKTRRVGLPLCKLRDANGYYYAFGANLPMGDGGPSCQPRN